MMFTPTKWTHHFGVYAGLAGSLAALAAIAVMSATERSPRNRTLFTAAVLFLTALAFTGSNGWWYVSSYGVPWFDKPPSIAGKGFATLLLGLTVLTLAYAAWQHFRAPYVGAEPARTRRFSGASLTVVAGLVVLFEVLSLLKGAVSQYPAYSVARSNVNSILGQSCGLARDVLVETDPNASMLQPLNPEPGADPLAGTASVGFTPNGVAGDLSADRESSGATGGANSVDPSDTDQQATANSAGTGGGTTAGTGVNGSRIALPFGLDPATTPVLGSFGSGDAAPASLTSGWYALPDAAQRDFLSVTAAGRIRSVDTDGIVTPGQSLEVEYATVGADGAEEILGRVAPIDIGPQPSWRNLRVPSTRSRRPRTLCDSSPPTRIWRATSGSPSPRRAHRGPPFSTTSSGPPTRCCWTGPSDSRSRASGRSTTATESPNCRSGASCPTATGPSRPTPGRTPSAAALWAGPDWSCARRRYRPTWRTTSVATGDPSSAICPSTRTRWPSNPT